MSNNKQSSSIEWFAKESWKLRVELEDGKISFGEYANKYYQLKEQAKAMYKEEMIQSYSNGWHDGQDIIINGIAHIQVGGDAAGQEYYNETYGGEK